MDDGGVVVTAHRFVVAIVVAKRFLRQEEYLTGAEAVAKEMIEEEIVELISEKLSTLR